MLTARQSGASHRRYMACIERTVILGTLSPEHADMFAIVRDTMEAMTDVIRAGVPLGAIDAEHRRVLDASPYGRDRYGACDYSLGATFAPTWMDGPPMIHAGNPLAMEAGMVLFPMECWARSADGAPLASAIASSSPKRAARS